MKAVDTKLERQVQFWSLLGPFFILLTVFITFIKPSPVNLYLGIAALAAIPLCWKWKALGLASVIGVLASLIVFHYTGLTHEDRFWLLGVAIAISVGSVVTTLSFEEAENLILGLKVQSDSRLDNLWHLDEKLKTLKEQFETEIRALTLQLENTHAETQKLKMQIATQEKLSRIQQGEIKVAYKEKQRVIDELFHARTALGKLQQVVADHQVMERQITELKAQVHYYQAIKTIAIPQKETAAASDIEKALRQSEGQYRQLTRQFKEKSDILDTARRELFLTEEKLLALKQEHKEQQLYARSEVIDKLERHIIALDQELEKTTAEHNQEVDQLHEVIAKLVN